MPNAPLKPCSVPGCPQMTAAIRCEIHTDDQQRQTSRERRIRNPHEAFYSSSAWMKLRKRVLSEEKWCPGWPPGKSCGKPTTEVDHIIRFKPEVGGSRLARENVQALCSSCHGSKSSAERRSDRRVAANRGGEGPLSRHVP